MALSKVKAFKGDSYSYWMLSGISYDKITNMTRGIISAYKDQPTREADITNAREALTVQFQSTGNLTVAQCYAVLKTSCPKQVLVTPAVPASGDTAAVPAVYATQESNFFADAVDV